MDSTEQDSLETLFKLYIYVNGTTTARMPKYRSNTVPEKELFWIRLVEKVGLDKFIELVSVFGEDVKKFIALPTPNFVRDALMHSVIFYHTKINILYSNPFEAVKDIYKLKGPEAKKVSNKFEIFNTKVGKTQEEFYKRKQEYAEKVKTNE